MDEAERIAKQLKPPRCPKCGMEVTYLNNICDEWATYIFTVDDHGNVDYEDVERVPGENSNFECPHCGEILFYDEEDAKNFLMGKVDNDK
jgi:predicted RNA-binding Zn-ribbon protein involved in translation (DUF1610 family)